MCESTSYILKNGKEELVFEGVDLLENTDDAVKMVDIFGEEKITELHLFGEVRLSFE